MRTWFFLFLLTINVHASESKLLPLFLEAADLYQQDSSLADSQVLQKELVLILKLLKDHQVLPIHLRELTQKKHLLPKLLPGLSYEQWGRPKLKEGPVPEIALHAVKFKVVEESDDALNDDLYMYFFVTDGVVPTGKVTSIYKGNDEGDAFFFNEIDRQLFPQGMAAKRPAQHLIIDYGIIESDGDDIRKWQALSGVILDLAISVYQNPGDLKGIKLEDLRKEVKALSEVILGINHDDRLVTGTMAFQGDELASMLENQSYVEFKQKHRKSSTFDDFKYEILFRLIRNDNPSLATR